MRYGREIRFGGCLRIRIYGYKHYIYTLYRMSSLDTGNMLSVSADISSHTATSPDKRTMLYDLYTAIRSIPDTEHVNLLRIISNHGQAPINENNNGCFINLSVLGEQCIVELAAYIQFVQVKNTAIGNMEKRMGDIETTFFAS